MGTAATELLVVAFGEVADDAWTRETERTKQLFRKRLESYPRGRIKGTVSLKNIGRGADWIVVAITMASVAGTAFFAIPKAHKVVRESIEEWGRIVKGLKSSYKWITGDRVAFYPDKYLLLLALEHLDRSGKADSLVYLGLKRLPEDNPDLQGLESLLFSFKEEDALKQVAVSRQGKVLWHNRIPARLNLRSNPLLLRTGGKRNAISTSTTAQRRTKR